MAISTLRGRSWYQDKDHLDIYIDRFKDLITVAGYDIDKKNVVSKFREGLELSIQNKVALQDQVLKIDDDEGWYESARRVVRARESNRAFQSPSDRALSKQKVEVKPSPLWKPTGGSFFPTTTPFPTYTPTPKVTNDNGPGPMDVDAARRRTVNSVICHRCGKAGHYANNCPNRLDIRSLVATMTEEDRIQLLQLLLAQADISGIPTGEADEEEYVNEGFGKSSE
ncbi:hypothetical protein M422DRAFT_226114 [Sphaerobolus stellatus SS14]|uniref:CCHC-type domain-containing protein n=1 Tax=Sphaerobolus stellatus (strain SS14) TaxID=990650 RepID=A0A0C9UWR8_SPHS4|nr:hypothetical protein M422DRAFT_226114 [Sphaerobolus stellatus SS14]